MIDSKDNYMALTLIIWSDLTVKVLGLSIYHSLFLLHNKFLGTILLLNS
jgi:hypothetical protein